MQCSIKILTNFFVSDIPEQLTFVPQHLHNDILSFTMTWRPQDHTNETDYQITVSPPSRYGPDVITGTTSVTLGLDNRTQYNITISSSVCTDRVNTTFIFGKNI